MVVGDFLSAKLRSRPFRSVIITAQGSKKPATKSAAQWRRRPNGLDQGEAGGVGLELLRAEEFSRRGRVGGDASSHVLCAVLAAAAAPDAPCSFGSEHAIDGVYVYVLHGDGAGSGTKQKAETPLESC